MKATQRVYTALRDEIQSGALPPGLVLSEVKQSERLGVSRTPLREAISRLEVDGLVMQRSPRITVVAEIDRERIRALFVVRRALEETAARAAATQRDARFVDLAEAFKSAEPGEEPDRYYALIRDFDDAIDRSVDNEFLLRALRPVRAHLGRVRQIAREKPHRLRASTVEHALIAQAIADGDADLAAHATHVHLHNALTSIEETLATDAHRDAERKP